MHMYVQVDVQVDVQVNVQADVGDNVGDNVPVTCLSFGRLPCFDNTIRNCHGHVSSNHLPFVTLPPVYNAFKYIFKPFPSEDRNRATLLRIPHSPFPLIPHLASSSLAVTERRLQHPGRDSMHTRTAYPD